MVVGDLESLRFEHGDHIGGDEACDALVEIRAADCTARIGVDKFSVFV